MEDIGIEVDIEYLKSFREELNREVKEIESSIFNLAAVNLILNLQINLVIFSLINLD